MFAYCENNPTVRYDPTGMFWEELWDKFTQSVQNASGYFVEAVGVSQVDAPMPGPALELGVSTFTDVVFGTASNSIAAATYRASIETSTSNNTKQQVGTQCANNLKRTKLYCDRRLR